MFREYLADNPDSQVPEYQTPCGIYEEGCGLDNVLMCWGHDEYMYHVVKDYLPTEALYMIRYHSFYPGHREGAYAAPDERRDRKYFNAVRAFNPYDLYTKAAERPDVEQAAPVLRRPVERVLPAAVGVLTTHPVRQRFCAGTSSPLS